MLIMDCLVDLGEEFRNQQFMKVNMLNINIYFPKREMDTVWCARKFQRLLFIFAPCVTEVPSMIFEVRLQYK